MTGSVTYVRVFRGQDEQWYYEARAGNNRTLSLSEGYTRRTSAVKAARRAYPGLPEEAFRIQPPPRDPDAAARLQRRVW